MPQPKVSLESFSVVRVDHAPDESKLRKVLLALDLDERELEKLYKILYQAKVKWVLGHLPDKQIEIAETWENRRVAAKAALVTLRRFLEPSWDLDRQKYAAEIAIHNEQTQRVAKRIIPDSIFKNRRKGRHLRQPWISEARKELRKLNIPKDLCNELLLAAGLSQHRKDHRSNVRR